MLRHLIFFGSLLPLKAYHETVMVSGHDEDRVIFLLNCESRSLCKGTHHALKMWFKLSEQRMTFQGADVRTELAHTPTRHYQFIVRLHSLLILVKAEFVQTPLGIILHAHPLSFPTLE